MPPSQGKTSSCSCLQVCQGALVVLPDAVSAVQR
jgi:hypothetical protein